MVSIIVLHLGLAAFNWGGGGDFSDFIQDQDQMISIMIIIKWVFFKFYDLHHNLY